MKTLESSIVTAPYDALSGYIERNGTYNGALSDKKKCDMLQNNIQVYIYTYIILPERHPAGGAPAPCVPGRLGAMLVATRPRATSPQHEGFTRGNHSQWTHIPAPNGTVTHGRKIFYRFLNTLFSLHFVFIFVIIFYTSLRGKRSVSNEIK